MNKTHGRQKVVSVDSGREIVALREDDLGALFQDLPSVKTVETWREDDTGDHVSDHYAEQYNGHAYAKVTLKDDEDVRGEAYHAAEDAGHVIQATGYHHFVVREGRAPLPENRTGMDAWDSLHAGDRFTVGMSVEHEALDVMRDPDDPEKVRRVDAIATYRLDKDNYDTDKTTVFKDANVNFRRIVQKDGSSVDETDNVRITEMNGVFIIPDAE